jgi:hypothetical protein
VNNRGFQALLIAVSLLLILGFMVAYTDATLPFIGHDYRLFIPRLLDTDLHYQINGLTIQWYTPSFGGGLPAYPNPLQMQFSLTQLLTRFFNPWIAVLGSTAIYVAIGYLVVFLFLKTVLDFKPLAAILGASLFSANGFIIERLVVGHVNFITFPLIVVPIYALLHPRLPRWLAGAWIAISLSAMVYTGGVYIGVIAAFSMLLLLPLIQFIKPDVFSWKNILAAFLWGGVLTGLLCGSKLYATAAYMNHFPRIAYDSYRSNLLHGLAGFALQLIGPAGSLPILLLIGKTYASYTVHLTQWTGTPYGFWELDTSLTPGVFFLLIVGAWLLAARRYKPDRKQWARNIAASVVLLFGIALTLSFALAKGGLYTQVRQLPVLESLHANTRFTAAFLLPLAVLAAKAFDAWTSRWKSSRLVFAAFAAINFLSLASLWMYFLLPLDLQNRSAELPIMVDTWDQIHAGKTFPVERIVPAMNDYEVIIYQSSNVKNHYEPLFLDDNRLLLAQVHAGSVYDVEGGYYNMTDPTSLVFPQSPDSTLFQRIRVSDSAQLDAFVHRRQPDWKLPAVQIVLDWAAGLAFLGLLLALGGMAMRSVLRTGVLHKPLLPRLKHP